MKVSTTNLKLALVEYVYNDTEIDKTTFDPATFSPTVSANSPLRVVVDHVAGTTTWYTYDRFGQPEKTESQNFVTTRTRDDFNRVASVGIDIGGNNASTTYTYASSVDDTLVAEETVWNMASEISTTYSRDNLQRLTETTVMVGSNGYKQTFEYVPRQKKERVIDGQIYVGGLPSLTTVTTDVGTTNYVAAFKEYSLSGTTSTLVRSDAVEYDANGNITKYGNVTYEYDKLNRLTRENNPTLDKTTVWDYDVSGNIVSRTEYAYTTDTVGTAVATYNYTYGNNWKDQLTSYNGQSIVYDQVGNPTHYKGATLTWFEGRNLRWYRAEDSDMMLDMEYSADGTRVRKTREFDDESASEIVTYVYNGSNLVYEKEELSNKTRHKYFLYNSQGIIGFIHNNNIYTYRKNLFGDIVAIYSGSTKVAEYRYDAWGNCLVIDPIIGLANTSVEFIGNQNPFRYRGYYWDNDLQLYYLQTRYYDPQTGRFINADSLEYLDPETIGGLNLYAYCGNDPINKYDPTGHFGISLIVGLVVSFAIGTAASAISQHVQYDDVNWLQACVDGLFAVASTALAYTGIGLIGSIAAGAGMGLAQYTLDSAVFHDDFSWSGALVATGLGALGGLASGRGAQHIKSIEMNLDDTGRAGVKAILTAFDRYGTGVGYQKVMNLWGGRVANSIAKSISRNFTKSALIIWGATPATYGASYGLGQIDWGILGGN